jgi:hypothetical protein
MSAEERIAAWLAGALERAANQPFDDLHIDEIDPRWKDRKTWLAGGLEALRIAAGLLGRPDQPVRLLLAFSLRSSEIPLGLDFHDASGLESALDGSPPSLYLFPNGVEPWEAGRRDGDPAPEHLTVETLDPALFGPSSPGTAAYFLEFRQPGSSEFCRTVLLVA